jgi:hypothetical protein
LWRLLGGDAGCVVVEAYYPASHRFYLEYTVMPAGGVDLVGSGSIRYRWPDSPSDELKYLGLDIPAVLPASLGTVAESAVLRLVEATAELGYRGALNIDVILTEDGRVIVNEVNARWGGGSVLHALGTRLIGEGYTRRVRMACLKSLLAPPWAELMTVLSETELEYVAGREEGVIVLAHDDARPGNSEFLVIAPAWERARAIESELRDACGVPAVTSNVRLAR